MIRPLAHVCKVCRQPLTGFTDGATGILSWLHSNVNDAHEPDPVPRVESNEADLRPVCDFCNTPASVADSWVHPASRFTTHLLGNGINVSSSDDGEGWSACRPCHNLLIVSDFAKLASRSATLLERRTSQKFADVLPFVKEAHGVFQATSTGDSFPAREYRPSN
jgi:hypothetical protein